VLVLLVLQLSSFNNTIEIYPAYIYSLESIKSCLPPNSPGTRSIINAFSEKIISTSSAYFSVQKSCFSWLSRS
jgi:hypothetical protein